MAISSSKILLILLFVPFAMVPQSFADDAQDAISYNKDYELMMELTYILQATPWLQIQPDAQWIVHPGGSSDIPNALVLGMQLAVDI